LFKSILMSIVELGGYPSFSELYKQCGYEIIEVTSMRKARIELKSKQPKVIVTEFNFQSDFRDRTSSIETLMASLQAKDQRPIIIVFYEKEFAHQYEKVSSRFKIDYSLSYPIEKSQMQKILMAIEM